MTEKDKIEGNTWEQWTTPESELGKVLSEKSLTVEQQVAQLRSEVQNINKWMFELLGLFKEVLKKQISTEDMIEKNIAATAIATKDIKETMSNIKTEVNENIDKITKDIKEKIDNTTKEVNEKIINTKKEIKEKIDFTDRVIDNTTKTIKSQVEKVKYDTEYIRNNLRSR